MDAVKFSVGQPIVGNRIDGDLSNAAALDLPTPTASYIVAQGRRSCGAPWDMDRNLVERNPKGVPQWKGAPADRPPL